MPQRRPKPDAISLEHKLQSEALPPLAKNPNGGVLDRQPEPSHHHVGALPVLRSVQHLPPTAAPIEEVTRREEAARVAALEGRCGHCADEGLAPPVDAPFSGDLPADCYEAPTTER